MAAPIIPIDEKARLTALHGLGVLDTPAEERFDRITRLACCIADVPIALVSLVDRDRQWFKSRHGLDAAETSREYSFCAHAIHQEDFLLVEDSSKDSRFADNPLVTGDPHIRFYAGHAIHAPDGSRIGTLCVIDKQPRTLTGQQLAGLRDLATMIDAELLKSRLSMATSAAKIGVYERSANFQDVWWSEVMWEIFGQSPQTFQPSWPAWLALVHDDDRERVRQTAGNAERARTALSIQYRIVRPDGSIRHVQSIGSTAKTRGDEGNRSISGVLLDVTARVQNEERDLATQRLLREQSHQSGVAENAAGVLHHVGNAINSVGIANNTARRDLKAIRPARLQSASLIVLKHRETLASFLTNDPQGQHLPDYLLAFAGQLAVNVQSVQTELDAIDTLLEQLRGIVGAQTALAKLGGQHEVLNLEELLEMALKGHVEELSGVSVVRDYAKVPVVSSNRHKLLQILVCLIGNACESIHRCDHEPPKILVSLYRHDNEAVVSVKDSGSGIPPEALLSLWEAGYTASQNGHGFRLHDSANAARDIGATLAVSSEGSNKGSNFTLRIPINEAADPAEPVAAPVEVRSTG